MMFWTWAATLTLYGCVSGFDRIDPLAWFLLVPFLCEGATVVFVRGDTDDEEDDRA